MHTILAGPSLIKADNIYDLLLKLGALALIGFVVWVMQR